MDFLKITNMEIFFEQNYNRICTFIYYYLKFCGSIHRLPVTYIIYLKMLVKLFVLRLN